jgi:hypothetical protein
MAQLYQYTIKDSISQKLAAEQGAPPASFSRAEAIFFLLNREHVRLAQLRHVTSHSPASLKYYLYDESAPELTEEILAGLALATGKPKDFWSKSCFHIQEIKDISIDKNALRITVSHMGRHLKAVEATRSGNLINR